MAVATFQNSNPIGLFCSQRCPGELIIHAYDLARALRDAAVPTVSGFHTPIERDMLDILLRGTQPITICPARSLTRFRIPRDWRDGVSSGRIHLRTPFRGDEHRITRQRAHQRNQFVLEQTDHILFIHASPGGSTEALCQEAIAAGKHVYTLQSPNNQNLVDLGARPISISDLVTTLTDRN